MVIILLEKEKRTSPFGLSGHSAPNHDLVHKKMEKSRTKSWRLQTKCVAFLFLFYNGSEDALGTQTYWFCVSRDSTGLRSPFSC